MLWVYARMLAWRAWVGARLRAWRSDRGQTTAEYALVILAAAAIAIVLLTWARSSGKLPAFFDGIIDRVVNEGGA